MAHVKFFEGCLAQILLSPFLNNSTDLLVQLKLEPENILLYIIT